MGDVDDLWFRTEIDPETERPRKVPTARHGRGKRYAARWRDPRGTQRMKSFERKRDAQQWVAQVEADIGRGHYIDPDAGKVRLADYAARWLAAQTFDASTREAVELRLRLHVFPVLGHRELRAIRPGDVQNWARQLADELAPATTRVIFANLSGVFGAAVDDGLIGRNPCRARSVRPPTAEKTKVVPWTTDRVIAVQTALPPRFRALIAPAAGEGLRQGEAFGLSPEDIDRDRGVVHVRRQVKIVAARLVFAPPKRGKSRVVPLAESVDKALNAHAGEWPPMPVTLPWKQPDGKPVTHHLMFTTRERGALNRNYFNRLVWKPALRAAGVPDTRDNGMHALRHFFASVVLDGGASIRDVAEWLGHEDPGFTLRVYAHLLPNSGEKLRLAIDQALAHDTRLGQRPPGQ
jgi:integrase